MSLWTNKHGERNTFDCLGKYNTIVL